jgi:hypothetical protein
VATHLELSKACSVFLRPIRTRGPLSGFPHLTFVLPARISVSVSTLYTFCTTELASVYLFVMAYITDSHSIALFTCLFTYILHFTVLLYIHIMHIINFL